MKRRGLWFRVVAGVLIGFAALAAVAYFYVVLPLWGIPFNAQRHGPPPLTPAWALECWLWEDDVNTAAFVEELLEGYAAHDIPVRTILIDSPWSTRYNDFTVDEDRYPEPERFFRSLEERGYRVVLWMTSMVDSYSKDTRITDSADWFDEARRNGYLAGDGFQVKWWKGKGGFIDYTNPGAMRWWRGMQQQVLDWGIDGWKLDGTATFFRSALGPIPLLYQRTGQGWMTTRGYMDLYYREEYRHGLTRNPEFITLARALDTPYLHPEGFAPIDAAPVTWIGDRQHRWKTTEPVPGDTTPEKDLMRKARDKGFEAAIRDILLSSRRGYAVVGCDIGGYHGGAHIPPRLYIRWAQFGAFTGLFLNGGHGERRLWLRSPEELEVIRKFAWLHTELAPYMYTFVAQCHEGGPSLIRPVRGKYQYLFGDALLVAPIYEDSLTRTVELPAGRWRYLFGDLDVIEGPCRLTRDFPLDEFPVYVRDGAILPLNVSRPYTGFGDRDAEGLLTVAAYPRGESTFELRHPDGRGATTFRTALGEQTLEIDVTGAPAPHILRILLPRRPRAVALDGKPLPEGDVWSYDADTQRLSVRVPGCESGGYVVTLGA